jgi:hypothetical protein
MAKRQSKKVTQKVANDETTQEVTTTGNADMPAFLAQTRGASSDTLDGLGQYQSTPRVAIVQPQSGPERKSEFGEGAVVILPDNELVVEAGGSFVAVPVYFFPTWEVWSDIDDEQSDMILDSSSDESSDIARRCKDPKQRTQKYNVGDEEYEMSYVESLNFIVRIEDGPAAGTFAVLSFNRGAHYVGRKIASVLKRRNIALYGNRVKFGTTHRTKGRYNWFEFALGNPTAEEGGSFVQNKDDFEALKQQHDMFRDAHRAGVLGVNRDDETHDESEAADDTLETSGKF